MNWALPSLHGGSLLITLTVPLTYINYAHYFDNYLANEMALSVPVGYYNQTYFA